MKLYMLDTDTCSYLLKKRPPSVLEKFKKVHTDQVVISVITQAELFYGVELSSSAKVNKVVVDFFLKDLRVLPWDSNAAAHYAEIRAFVKKKGCVPGNMDLMIAAHARSCGAVVVTNNEKDFRMFPGVVIENWVE